MHRYQVKLKSQEHLMVEADELAGYAASISESRLLLFTKGSRTVAAFARDQIEEDWPASVTMPLSGGSR